MESTLNVPAVSWETVTRLQFLGTGVLCSACCAVVHDPWLGLLLRYAGRNWKRYDGYRAQLTHYEGGCIAQRLPGVFFRLERNLRRNGERNNFGTLQRTKTRRGRNRTQLNAGL